MACLCGFGRAVRPLWFVSRLQDDVLNVGRTLAVISHHLKPGQQEK